MSAMLCANKREVLDRVKAVLEAHVHSGVIDREDLKTVSKRSVEAIAPPVALERVDEITLQLLVEFLYESGAEEASIVALRDALPAATTGTASVGAEKRKSKEREEQRVAAPSAIAGLSLSAFQARMMKKREEIRRHRGEMTATVTADESARVDSPAASVSGTLGVLYAEERRGDDAADSEPPARRQKTEDHQPPRPSDPDLYAGLVDATAGGRQAAPKS